MRVVLCPKVICLCIETDRYMNMDEYSQIDTHSKNVISANVNVNHPHQLTSYKDGGERETKVIPLQLAV